MTNRFQTLLSTSINLRPCTKVLTGGHRVTPPGTPTDGSGTFYAPTVLTGCSPDMLVFQQETFGPVAAISTFDTEDAGGVRASHWSCTFSAQVKPCCVKPRCVPQQPLQDCIYCTTTQVIPLQGTPPRCSC